MKIQGGLTCSTSKNQLKNWDSQLLSFYGPGALKKVIIKYQKFNDYGQKYAEKATLLLLNIKYIRVILDFEKCQPLTYSTILTIVSL